MVISRIPPKLGFLSTVPSDASGRMQSAASAAAKANNNFPGMSFFFLIREYVADGFPWSFCVCTSYFGAGFNGKFCTGRS